MEKYIYTDITELVCPIGKFSVNYENTKIPFSVRKNSYNVPYYDITIETNYAIDIDTNLLEINKQYNIVFSEGGLHFRGSDEHTESLTNTIGKWSVGIGSYDINDKCYYTNELHKGYDVWKNENGYDELLEVVALLGADRVTQHVPKVALEQIQKSPLVLDEIALAVSQKLNALPHAITVGVENMHMTATETAAHRRFGYTPEECLAFMRSLRERCHHRVGINFDIGHARNNAPFSQRYQISTWLSMLGENIVGYHLHQVTLDDGVFENHMPLTHIYGSLISYASFFKYWEKGKIAKAPLIFEMRPEGAYEITLATFAAEKSKCREQ